MRQCFTVLFTVLLLFVVGAQAESEFLKQFNDKYGQLGSDLASKPPAEVAEISNFVYQKDIATFTFTEGKLYLLRHLEGRPTTAIFLGAGHATIEIPNHSERLSLEFASGKPAVNDTFEVAFINFADDFDLRVKEKFTFEESSLGWREFNKSQQGEFFFKPVVMHTYDNYFQLLRSVYERAEDGYFWIDFNRYVYSFDPNRPEEVVVAYEYEGGDTDPTNGAVLQRREHAVYDDSLLSAIPYPTTILSKSGTLTMTGLDGQVIDQAVIDVTLQINADSLRFMSLFLHSNLDVDSVLYQGRAIDFKRRNDLTLLGIIMPVYMYAGDTITLTVCYHGKDYRPALPFAENPAPSAHDIILDVPKGFNYLAPDLEQVESPSGKRTWFASRPTTPMRMYEFQPYATGFDTIGVTTPAGIQLEFLKSKAINKKNDEHFIPDEYYRTTSASAVDFLAGQLGPPPNIPEIWIYPKVGVSMPGMIGIPQVRQLIDGTGGLAMSAGNMFARQWFGALMRPASDREYWLLDAVPDYLSLMCAGAVLEPGVTFTELAFRRNSVYDTLGMDADKPLASGTRVSGLHRVNKGTWVLHMLRYLMYDLESHSDRTFLRFLAELKVHTTLKTFSNHDIMKLAEKHYGGPMDWFAGQWLYGRNIPEYEVNYSVEDRGGESWVTADVTTQKVAVDFKMPVVVAVRFDDGQVSYHRPMIEGLQDTFELGPFATAPKEIVFNEFYSVLSKDKVHKK